MHGRGEDHFGRGPAETVFQSSPLGDVGLAAALRDGTSELHRLAERSGVVRDLLQGRSDRQVYVLYLRNLLPAYAMLEDCLERHVDIAELDRLRLPELYRSAALRNDLDVLAGPHWTEAIHVLPVATRYASHIAAAARRDPLLLVGHAYVRYLGDLSGGQILKRLLARSLGLDATGLAFYEFPQVTDIPAFKAGFRAALDAATTEPARATEIVEVARTAFRLNIAVSRAVERHMVRPPPTA